MIVVAGGSGTRMKSDVPKQFIELNNKPILLHTLQKFTDAFSDIKIVLVLASVYKQEWERICKKHQFDYPVQLAEGGETRFHSVKNGLTLVPENCVVGVHDAARPLVSIKTIIDSYKLAEEKGNASPCISLNESIREVKEGANKAVERTNYFIIQTPQCFQSSLLKKAFTKSYNPSFTDDASVLEAMGEKINLIEGNRENIKITTQQDLLVAEALMSQ